jgi:hypothetical protein
MVTGRRHLRGRKKLLALGERLGLGGLGAQPFPVERGGGLGGESVQQPPAGAARRRQAPGPASR